MLVRVGIKYDNVISCRSQMDTQKLFHPAFSPKVNVYKAPESGSLLQG